MTPAEALEACLKALNNVYIRGHEKRAGVAWIAGKPHRVPLLLARTQALIAARATDPHSLENWAGRARFARAESPMPADYVSQPTAFWARDYQTTA